MSPSAMWKAIAVQWRLWHYPCSVWANAALHLCFNFQCSVILDGMLPSHSSIQIIFSYKKALEFSVDEENILRITLVEWIWYNTRFVIWSISNRQCDHLMKSSTWIDPPAREYLRKNNKVFDVLRNIFPEWWAMNTWRRQTRKRAMMDAFSCQWWWELTLFTHRSRTATDREEQQNRKCFEKSCQTRQANSRHRWVSNRKYPLE